jgi:hypothetical protein
VLNATEHAPIHYAQAAICAADHASAIAACYAQAELQVPPDVIG